MRAQRCCFSGHRPEKLDCPQDVIIAALRREILAAIRDGYATFISGMARGVDLWAARVVLDLRRRDPALKLICAVPYKGFARRWSMDWQEQYHS
nr:SLOG family protein [Maliibacterium massiliense]